jgi:hypothetical protein
MKSHTSSVAALACLFAFGAAFAQSAPPEPAPQPGPGGHRHGPPPEAIAACAKKAVSDVCSFTLPNGDAVTGQCLAPRGGAGKDGAADSTQSLACRPDHPRGNKQNDASGSQK